MILHVVLLLYAIFTLLSGIVFLNGINNVSQYGVVHKVCPIFRGVRKFERSLKKKFMKIFGGGVENSVFYGRPL